MSEQQPRRVITPKSNNRSFHCKNIYFDEPSGGNDREAATITCRYDSFFFDNKCGGRARRFLIFPLIETRAKRWFCSVFGSGMVPSPTSLGGSSPTFPLYRSPHAESEWDGGGGRCWGTRAGPCDTIYRERGVKGKKTNRVRRSLFLARRKSKKRRKPVGI